MNSTQQNPAANQLGAGVTEDQVRGAVDKSGYPLQTTVADILKSRFYVQQEWCYVDRHSKELRAIDLHARQMLHHWGTGPQPRVRPHLDLLVECKQSQLPYIFFLSNSNPVSLDSPEIVGLNNQNIEIATDDDLSTYSWSHISALDLDTDDFQKAPPYSSTFSKCVRKGAEVELSGTEAYTGLVLPLIKALHHFRIAKHPADTAWYFDARMVITLAVLDAPMIAASFENQTTTLTLTPWVRVLRHEYIEEAEQWERDHVWTVDVVHKDFLATYVDAHALPFAQRFSDRALKHATELATGKGFVPGMGKDPWSPVEGRLRRRPPVAPVGRAKLFLRNLAGLLNTRKSEQ